MPAWALLDLDVDGGVVSVANVSGVGIVAAIDGNPCQVLFPRLPATWKVRGGSIPLLRPPDDEGPWSILKLRSWGGYGSLPAADSLGAD